MRSSPNDTRVAAKPTPSPSRGEGNASEASEREGKSAAAQSPLPDASRLSSDGSPLPPAGAGPSGGRSTHRFPEGRGKSEPERRCVITGTSGPKSGLIRLALSPDGSVAPDVRARAPGRGAWIGVNRDALEAARAKGKLKGALARAFKSQSVTVPDDLAANTEAALARNALDRLGMEARAGTLLTGSDRIDDAARKGQVRLLLHAADAGEDGNRRLDQAWRVGSEDEGSARAGLVLGADRTILSAALGRENVVHIAVTDGAAAARVSDALDRWHHFIGRVDGTQPCETAAQGSEARGAQDEEGSLG